MSTVLLIILLAISIVMTGLILIQQSEGGALGIGGGGGGGLMSGRSAANSVARMTGWLGAAFLVCSLLLSIVFNRENQEISATDETNAVEALTIDVDSGETTLPLNGENEAPVTDETVSETIVEDTPSEPVKPEAE